MAGIMTYGQMVNAKNLIPRHNDINEKLARSILRKAQKGAKL